MPSLYILAGPNGSGKTSFYFLSLRNGFINPEIPFLNIDLIVKNELGAYTAENFIIAERLYRERVNTHITKSQDFMIESNLAAQADYVWLEAMQNKGYEITLYFMCTDDIDIHKERVKKRVSEGGHDVAEAIIEHRYTASLSYLKTKLTLFKNVFFIDNSDETKIVAQLQNGTITYLENTGPAWTKNALEIIIRLANRKLNS